MRMRMTTIKKRKEHDGIMWRYWDTDSLLVGM